MYYTMECAMKSYVGDAYDSKILYTFTGCPLDFETLGFILQSL